MKAHEDALVELLTVWLVEFGRKEVTALEYRDSESRNVMNEHANLSPDILVEQGYFKNANGLVCGQLTEKGLEYLNGHA